MSGNFLVETNSNSQFDQIMTDSARNWIRSFFDEDEKLTKKSLAGRLEIHEKRLARLLEMLKLEQLFFEAQLRQRNAKT
jgi:hypothetical protein